MLLDRCVTTCYDVVWCSAILLRYIAGWRVSELLKTVIGRRMSTCYAMGVWVCLAGIGGVFGCVGDVLMVCEYGTYRVELKS